MATLFLMMVCYGLHVCASPHPTPNIYVGILMLSMMDFEGGAFGRWLGHEGEALMNGIIALMKEAQESSLLPCEDMRR